MQAIAVTWQVSGEPREVGSPGSLGVFGPDDKPTFLATRPPGGCAAIGPKNPIVAAADGSFWSACPESPNVAVTRDGGRAWTMLPTVASTVVDWVATADGRTVYAAATDRAGPRLLRSADGGLTWTQAATLDGLDTAGKAISADRSANGLALPNGDLIMAQSGDGGTYRLKAGTTTAERLTGAPAHVNALYRTADWVVAASVWDQREHPDLGSVVSLSPDGGTTWLAIPAPPG